MKYLAFAGIPFASIIFAAAISCAAEQTVPEARPGTFELTLAKDAALTSAGVYDPGGHLVRTLWTMEPQKAGTSKATWDGLDEFGRPAPDGDYTYRLIVNSSTYRNIGIVGNTGTPPGELQHIQHGVISVVCDAKGNIYTANGWEEAGHDFKVQGPDGKTLFHARYQIRNGNPNGAPHAIAIDEKFIYCATHGWDSEQWKNKMQIQRFHIKNGNHEKFTDPALEPTAGHIELYEWPKRQIPEGTPKEDADLMALPVRALAILGDSIIATDALGGKIHKFHKVTGTRQGEFAVKLPHALAIDTAGRLWIGHERHQVSVFTIDGKDLGTRLTDVGEVKSLAFGPKGLLYVADGEACRVKVYDVSKDKPQLVRTFGQPAKPGDYAPERFYSLRGAAVDPQGNIVTIAGVTVGGARIAKFSPDGKCLWEHMALMFCDVGNYSQRNPDEVITQRFHRLMLTDKKAGTWEYRGTLLDGDPSYIWGNHGVLKLLDFGGSQFLYQCYGDGMQIYRRRDDVFRPAAMVGGNEPTPDGRFVHNLPAEERKPDGWWTWTDANDNGKVDDKEVIWFKEPGEARYAIFGMNVDDKGTLVYCEQHTWATWELPMSGLDANGNPVYDWRLARQIVPRDTSPVKFMPLMAIRSDDGSLYAFGRSEAWERPGGKTGGYAWMGGWALFRYDKNNKFMWAARLPNVCVGMDAIPGGRGVMLGYFEKGYVYHYTPDGLLIGYMQVGDAAGKVTGWMDNTAAVAVNRDPRDGMLDVFGEDSWLNRMIWYRVDDRDIRTISGKVSR